MASEAGIPAGVNMTLMPGNIMYAHRLAENAKESGASFFRSVPLLPIGRGAGIHLFEGFFTECIMKVLSLQRDFRCDSQEDTPKFTRRKLAERGVLFAVPCNGGLHSIAIEADGQARICPMIDSGEKPVYVTDSSVGDCLKVLNRRRRVLQRKIVSASQSECGSCKFRDTCGGGCFAEWLSRGSEGGQPCCYYKGWKKAITGIPFDGRTEKILGGIIHGFENRSVFSSSVVCLRALPFWIVNFG
jgi:radical SAM protein with 4Fe4S-binding SPASM domain